MNSPPDISLRDRKRRATLLAIEDAATELVLEYGYDAVTVEQICAAAEVSKRTFFNYVASKEAAVIGATPQDLPEAESRDFLDRADPDVPRALMRVFIAGFAATRIADRDQTATLVQRRREIFRAEPELGAARMTASSRFQLRLVDLVTGHLEQHPRLRRLGGVSAEAEARAYVALVAASGNLGMATWLNRDSASFADLHADCVTALGQLAALVGEPCTHHPGARAAAPTPAFTPSATTDGTPHE
ncbi:helix-turn-helix domain-containing protein [Dietzia sp. CH92]|uniref:TetR/AcrR family transcriptional regulator n=1 Tax=Dietzia sp. CH92 TaxID=3051823 RepID=UPI0028D20BAB|nr:helix-turn-helix domain-containing protein [Dietzia sp. CH92]